MKIAENFRKDELIAEPVSYWIEDFDDEDLARASEIAGLDTSSARIANTDYVDDYEVLDRIHGLGTVLASVGCYQVMELESGEKFIWGYHEGGSYEVIFQP